MYTVFIDDVCIYDDRSPIPSLKLSNPRLNLEVNTAGSFEFNILPNNPGYNILKRMISTVYIRGEDNRVLWSGRIIRTRQLMNYQVEVVCEGALAYLNDSIQPPHHYSGGTMYSFLKSLLDIHNSRVPENRRINMGVVTMEIPSGQETIHRYTNYESTLFAILDKLQKRFGGYFTIDYQQNNKPRLNYISEPLDKNPYRSVIFGENMLDYAKSYDISKLITVIIPRGKNLGTTDIGALENYVTIAPVNGGSIYLQNNQLVNTFGKIEKVIDFKDVEDPTKLKELAVDYITNVQFDDMVLEVTFVDLPEEDRQQLDIMTVVRCESIPHGIKKNFAVSKLNIPLDMPADTKITLGFNQSKGISGASVSMAEMIDKKLSDIPDEMSILKKAKDQAGLLINEATNGYITIVKKGVGQNKSEALIISDNPVLSSANRMWKWNIAGLGYSKDGGRTYNTAITMDGRIVADFITTGTLNAGVIRAGILADVKNNTVWDLKQGTLHMKKGSITLGSNFSVNDNGFLVAKAGRIASFRIASSSIFNDVMSLDENGLFLKRTGTVIGRIGTNQHMNDPNQKGLVFDLENSGSYMGFLCRDNPQDGYYTFKFGYVNTRFEGFPAKHFVINAPIDARNHIAEHFWIDSWNGGCNGGVNSGQLSWSIPTSINSDGTIAQWINYGLEFRNGFLAEMY